MDLNVFIISLCLEWLVLFKEKEGANHETSAAVRGESGGSSEEKPVSEEGVNDSEILDEQDDRRRLVLQRPHVKVLHQKATNARPRNVPQLFG